MSLADLDRLTVDEIRSWQKYFTKWRWPDEQADLTGAVLASIVANIMRPKGIPPYRAVQFRVGRRNGYDNDGAPAPKSEADKFRGAFGRS